MNKTPVQLFNETVAFIRTGLVEGKWDKNVAFNLQADMLRNIASISHAMVELPKGIYVPQEKALEIHAFFRDGQKIKAMKVVKDATGLSLLRAKECIDEYWRIGRLSE